MNFWDQLPNGQEVPNCSGHRCPLSALQSTDTISLTSYFFSLVPLPLHQLLKPFFLFLLFCKICRIFCSLPKESDVGSFSFSSLHTWCIPSMCWKMHWRMDVEKTSESEPCHFHPERLGYVITGLFRIVESQNP